MHWIVSRCLGTFLLSPVRLTILIPTDSLFASVAKYERPPRCFETVLDRLLRLDSWTRPGLSGPEFNRLFAQCRCGLVMTRRVFRNHICAVANAVVPNSPIAIDLTSDDDVDISGGPTGPGSHGYIVIDLTSDSADED
jgi:hypothetical protein